MKPHVHLRQLQSLAHAAGIAFSILGGTASAVAADDAAAFNRSTVAVAASDRDTRPAAAFFSISEVLAKLDRQGGRGSGAVRLAAYTPPDNATDAAPLRGGPVLGKEPFGLFTFRAPDGLLWRKWRHVEADLTSEKAVLDQCRADLRSCPSYAAQFLRLVDTVRSRSGRARIEEANRGINTAIRYVSDLNQHGEPDRWSAPLATFATAKGDCEDYAIAKYAALIEAGVSRDDLQIVLVRDRSIRQDHAVLAARHDGRWLLLDNRHSMLMEDSGSTSFAPLFAINHDGVHLFAAPYAERVLLGDEIAAAPATANSDSRDSQAEWTGADAAAGGSNFGSQPLLL